MLAALLRHGADIDAPEPFHGRPPLHLAVASRNLSLARGLLQHGANIARRDRGKKTPLMLARRLMREQTGTDRTAAAAMVELLLAHAAGDSLESATTAAGVTAAGGLEMEEGCGFEEENPLRFRRGSHQEHRAAD